MKDFIILFASILLGLYIFGLIAGSEGSIKQSLKDVWESQALSRQYVYMTDER